MHKPWENFWEYVEPSVQFLKNGTRWYDLVTSKMGTSCVSDITWEIYMKLIKKEANYNISYIKENAGAQNIRVMCRYFYRSRGLKKKRNNHMNLLIARSNSTAK